MNWFTKLFKTKQKKAEIAARVFNDYQRWFTSLDETEEDVDLTLTIRIRAFGTQQEKQSAWDTDWRSKHPTWGKVSAGTNVSSDPPELWMDLRMCRGGLIINPAILGHELLHSIHNTDKRVVNPDLLIGDIY